MIEKEKSILITGAGGVLGKALVTLLRNNGFNRILTPRRIELNLLDKTETEKYFSQHRPDVLIHLASVVYGLAGNMRNQMKSVLENSEINSNIFNAVNRFPVKELFFAGTVASYPFPYKTLPLIESEFFDGLPHSGEFGYAMAKRHAYSYIKILSETHSIRSIYGIFTNLFGEHDRFDEENGHVVPSLVSKVYRAKQEGSALMVWGNGLAERDFLYSQDAARAILFLLNQKGANGLINISSGVAVKIRSLAEQIAKAAGVEKIEFEDDKPVGIPLRVVDNSKLLALGFNSFSSLEEGISRTYKWFCENQNGLRR